MKRLSVIGAKPDFSGKEPSMIVTAASRTWIDPKIVAGVTKDKKVLLFLSKDYDNRGNIYGPWEDFTKVAGPGGFYLATSQYSPEALEKLGWTPKDVERIVAVVKTFAQKH